MPYITNTDAPTATEATTTSSMPPQSNPKKSKVMTNRELLVSLHQKYDRHHDWSMRQMRSILHDVNRIRNVTMKNAFLGHEACRRAWYSLTLPQSIEDLKADGFKEQFSWSSSPPATAQWSRTPSPGRLWAECFYILLSLQLSFFTEIYCNQVVKFKS